MFQACLVCLGVSGGRHIDISGRCFLAIVLQDLVMWFLHLAMTDKAADDEELPPKKNRLSIQI